MYFLLQDGSISSMADAALLGQCLPNDLISRRYITGASYKKLSRTRMETPLHGYAASDRLSSVFSDEFLFHCGMPRDLLLRLHALIKSNDVLQLAGKSTRTQVASEYQLLVFRKFWCTHDNGASTC